MANLVGQNLGNYRLVKLLGQGGFADVYLGEHYYLKTQAAIKVVQRKMTLQELQDFCTEAKIIANLKHPHIVRVLEFGVENNLPFLVMDYALHGTLRDRHPQGSILTINTILPYVKQAAIALQYAHMQKIVHRDVKPENMLIDANNDILLGDFGIAVVAHRTSSLSTQVAFGTLAYMAPEQIQGKARPASDQYSLGAIVYEWISGTYLFDGSSSIEIAMKHISEPPPHFKKGLNISSHVEHVILKALAKDPIDRYPTVQLFAEDLEKAAVLKPQNQRQAPFAHPNVAVKQQAQPYSTTSSVQTKPGQVNSQWKSLAVLVGVIFMIIGLVFYENMHGSNTSGIQSVSSPVTEAHTTNAVATAPALPNPYTNSGTLVLDDPLNDNSRGYQWEEGERDGGSCTFTGGTYHTIIPQAGVFHSCLASAKNFGNFAFEVNLRILSGDFGGIVFRADRVTTHFYSFLMKRDGSYSLKVYYDKLGNYNEIASGMSAPLNGTDFVGVVAQGNDIRLYVNRKLIVDVSDSTYTQGQIGIVTLSGEATFSHARVWIL